MKKNPRVSIAQTGSQFFDKKGSVDKVLFWMEKAVAEKSDLVLFPEAFIPAYPRGLCFGTSFGSRSPEGKKLYERYYRESVTPGEKELAPVLSAAKKNNLFVSLGIVEKDKGTLFCTQLLITPQGKIAGKHRKIKPTGTERVVWGEGDGTTLSTFETPAGILGTLICWENYMPLARMALYNQGVTIYLAPTADQRDSWQKSMQHIAVEGRCFVLTANQYMRFEDYPQDIIEAEHLTPEKTNCRGGSAIISPSGEYLAGPLYGSEGLLVADLDMGEVIRGKMELDIAGHYSRPDIFHFTVPDQPDTLKTI